MTALSVFIATRQSHLPLPPAPNPTPLHLPILILSTNDVSLIKKKKKNPVPTSNEMSRLLGGFWTPVPTICHEIVAGLQAILCVYHASVCVCECVLLCVCVCMCLCGNKLLPVQLKINTPESYPVFMFIIILIRKHLVISL